MKPYLSVVVTSRNDDHGGNPLYRTQLFVNGLIAQCERFRLPAEIVFVEWNPPDGPRLADVLDWPPRSAWCQVRFVEVPGSLHATLENADRLPLFQMIGKNVGIRRARGDFVLATNIDILLSDGLMRFLSERRLEEGRVYRVDRFDVPATLDPSWSIAQQLEHCARTVVRVNARGGTLDVRTGRFYWIYPEYDILFRLLVRRYAGRVEELIQHLQEDTGGASSSLSAALERLAPRVGRVAPAVEALRVGRFVLWNIYRFLYWFVAGFNDPRQVPRRLRRRLVRVLAARGPLDTVPPIVGEDVQGRGTSRSAHRAAVRAFVRVWREEQARLRLHTNASGDFTIMSAQDWARAGAYAEFEMYSMHIDGLLLYQAHYAGIRETFLPYPVYHIEHGGGFRPEAKGADSLDAELTRRRLPQLSGEQLAGWYLTMYETRRPIRFNSDEWGLVRDSLEERAIYEGGTLEPALRHARPTED